MEHHWTPQQVAELSNEDFLTLLAAHRLQVERANRAPTIQRRI